MAVDFISISSNVAYGTVGHTAIVPGLLSLGLSVCAISTVHLSCHPALGSPVRQDITADYLKASIDQILNKNWDDGLKGILTGYFTSADQVAAAAAGIAGLKERHADLVYLCDPVIGDTPKGLYVPEAIAEAIRDHLVPLADIITPNVFELGWLSGEGITGPENAVSFARLLHPGLCLVTSVPSKDVSMIRTVLVQPAAAGFIETERREDVPHGTGDLLSALFLGNRVRFRNPEKALAESIARLETVIGCSDARLLNLHEGLFQPVTSGHPAVMEIE